MIKIAKTPKKEKKQKTNRLENAAKITKNIGTITLWSVTILFVVLGIPLLVISVQFLATLEHYLTDATTDKSINLVGSLIDEDGARVLASALTNISYSEGCDYEEVTVNISYDNSDYSDESEHKNEKIVTETSDHALTPSNTSNTSVIDSGAKDSFRNYIVDINKSTTFSLTFHRKAEGCHKEQGG